MIATKDVLIKENISICDNDSIINAIELMKKNHHGVVVVLSDEKVFCVITERDIVSLISKEVDIDVDINIFFKQNSHIITINQSRSIDYSLHVLIENSIRRLVVVDSSHKFVGIITQDSILKHLDNDAFKSNIVLSSFIDKNINIVTIDENRTIIDAFSIINSKNIGSIVILNSSNEPIGILTESDAINIFSSSVSLKQKVSTVMHSPIIGVDESSLLVDTMNVLAKHNIRRVIVYKQYTKIPISILSTRDIAKRVERNYTYILESKLENLKSTLNYMGESIIELCKDHNEHIIQWANDSSVENFGNVVGKNIIELIDKDNWKKIIERVVDSGTCSKYKVKIGKKSFELLCSRHFVDHREILLIIMRDISVFEDAIINEKNINLTLKEKVEINKKIVHQNKLEAMGEMIGAIAHQWRQPLNEISIGIQNLKYDYMEGKLENKAYIKEFIDKNKKVVNLMSKTIDNFRNFFKVDKEMKEFSVIESTKLVAKILEAQLKDKNIDISIGGEEFIYYGLQSEYQQVILNIINNAKDVLIEKKINNPKIEIIIKENEVSIQDNAGGIPQDILDRVFEPYFTTKEQGKGTGMGLYMSKMIIEENMGGELSVTNVDNGARFVIDLNKEIDEKYK